ncbi:PAP-specific phosphatase HAL2-like [Bienertia sinuspersici]
MMEEGEFSVELDLAVRIVHLVCTLCQKVQKSLLSTGAHQINSKDDDSLVTVAVFKLLLAGYFQNHLEAKMYPLSLKRCTNSLKSDLLLAVVKTVNECFSEAPRFGLKLPDVPLKPNQVIEAIGRCNSSGGPKGRHWVLDPVDGTLGFVRGNQYAVALALIKDGRVVLGVLGCPNYPVQKGLVNHQVTSEIPSATPDMWEKGCVMYAKRGTDKAWMQPLVHGELKLDSFESAISVRVSAIEDPGLATFCEPVENATTVTLSQKGNMPLRVYSMVKYAAIARGDAEIYMRFARAGYKEKIWDHAAGVLIVQEAGGVVTDAGGRPLDFSRGIYLEGLDRGIIACSGAVLHEKIICSVDASWESSLL